MKITVIIKEARSPYPPVYPLPLIYTVDVLRDGREHEKIEEGLTLREIYEEQILDLVADERGDEIGATITHEVRDGLELLFAFEGELSPIMDWRAA